MPHRWRNRVLLMLIPAIVAFCLGAWAGVTQGPRFFGDDTDAAGTASNRSPDRDQNVTSGPDASSTPGARESAQGSGESPSGTGESAPTGETALRVDKAVSQNKGCSRDGDLGSQHGWEEATASIAQQSFRAALACPLAAKDQTASIDYIVPNGATTLKATVGQDDSSAGTGKIVRFTVIDVTTDQPLASADARFGEAVEVSAPVKDLVRVQLVVAVVESSDFNRYGGVDASLLTTAVWAVPAFS